MGLFSESLEEGISDVGTAVEDFETPTVQETVDFLITDVERTSSDIVEGVEDQFDDEPGGGFADDAVAAVEDALESSFSAGDDGAVAGADGDELSPELLALLALAIAGGWYYTRGPGGD